MTTTEAVKRLAQEMGFDRVGIAAATPPFTDRANTAVNRVREGLMDGLPWYTEGRVRRGADPGNLLPNAKSIVSLALSYHAPRRRADEGGDRQGGAPPWNPRRVWPGPRAEESPGPGHTLASPSGAPLGRPSPRPRGRVARYAWGEDYHRVFERKVKAFVARLPEVVGNGRTSLATRWYTDTGPMLDRAVAERAGVGWFGKNTNILTPMGSWVLLAHVLTDLELEPDAPLKKTCGACRLCVDACPTGAIVAPGVLDNRLCISYLTIENRGPIPRRLRPLLGDWVFGCDVCQDVCPVNRKAQVGKAYRELTRDADDRAHPELIEMLAMDEAAFRQRFRASAVLRAKLHGMKRNVCVALGNIGDERATPALARALREEPSLVRGHAAWALGRIGGPEAARVLEDAQAGEADEWVREEIETALNDAHAPR